jgi:hypothetical protein
MWREIEVGTERVTLLTNQQLGEGEVILQGVFI